MHCGETEPLAYAARSLTSLGRHWPNENLDSDAEMRARPIATKLAQQPDTVACQPLPLACEVLWPLSADLDRRMSFRVTTYRKNQARSAISGSALFRACSSLKKIANCLSAPMAPERKPPSCG